MITTKVQNPEFEKAMKKLEKSLAAKQISQSEYNMWKEIYTQNYLSETEKANKPAKQSKKR